MHVQMHRYGSSFIGNLSIADFVTRGSTSLVPHCVRVESDFHVYASKVFHNHSHDELL